MRVVFVLLCAIVVIGCSSDDRYQLTPPYLLDTRTGKLWRINGTRKVLVEEGTVSSYNQNSYLGAGTGKIRPFDPYEYSGMKNPNAPDSVKEGR